MEVKGNADKAILLVNQAQNEQIEKKLRLLVNKQFFKLENYTLIRLLYKEWPHRKNQELVSSKPRRRHMQL